MGALMSSGVAPLVFIVSRALGVHNGSKRA
jgi:hypothetical protein